MEIDGRVIAQRLYAELAPQFAALGRTVTLGILVVGDDPVIESFVRIKAKNAAKLGVGIERVDLDAASKLEDICAAVRSLALRADGIIVQLPLPEGISVDAVLAEIPPEKDVDAINPRTILETERVRSPVALAVVEILRSGEVQIADATTVVVGAGRLVGTPSASLLTELGARVTVLTRGDSLDVLQSADIIIAGAGNPGFIKPEHIKEGVALIDAGTSEQGGKVVGDADPACAAKSTLFTPVPGGVGPVAVAIIFRNLLTLAR